MCKECHGVEFIANGDKMFYNSFDELSQELKDKFKSKAKSANLQSSKNGYVGFINELNKRGDELIGDYINNSTKTKIKFNECGHTPQKGITPNKYKLGRGCAVCKVKDISNIRFGKLVAVKRIGCKQRSSLWLCKCDCGTECEVLLPNLLRGCTTSCGCLGRNNSSKRLNERWQDEEYRQKMKGVQHSNMSGENNIHWKGGITPIRKHLRGLPIVGQWRKDTYKRENNKCQLTGKHVHGGNSDVHHLYGFNMIVQDAHNIYNIKIKEQIKDYTEEELKLLEDYVAEWHKDTTNAVLLSEEVHNLFHTCRDKDGNVLYGSGNNTPEQFEEFKQRYINGEFDDLLGDDLNV